MAASFISWISPLGLTIAILVVAMCFTRSLKSLRISTFFATVVLVGFSFPYVSQGLLFTLEKRVPQQTIASIPPADLAILLGGGIKVPYGYRLRPELGKWGDRLAFTAELYSTGKISKILISAGNDLTSTSGLTESELSKNILVQWGVNAEDIIVETQSTSTVENATKSAPIVKAIAPESIYLISSAFHLPRSHALFCSEGMTTVALPSNHLSSGDSHLKAANWTPLASSLYNSTLATKEYFAMLYHGVRGKIPLSTLWAAPAC